MPGYERRQDGRAATSAMRNQLSCCRPCRVHADVKPVKRRSETNGTRFSPKYPATPALVAQGIEHRPPEPCAQVRILPRAHCDVSRHRGQTNLCRLGVRWLWGEGLVVLRRVECEMAEEFAFLAQDPDVEVGDEDDDPSSLVCSTDAHMMQLGSVPQGEDAGLVDLVVADSGVGSRGVLVRVR